MPLLRYNVATTLDGFIASSDGSTSWIIEDPTIDFDVLYAQFSLFIMGRKTYEVMLSYGRNPLAKYPKEAVVVVSTTMKPDEHPGITIVSEGVVEFVREHKREVEKDIWIMGGGDGTNFIKAKFHVKIRIDPDQGLFGISDAREHAAQRRLFSRAVTMDTLRRNWRRRRRAPVFDALVNAGLKIVLQDLFLLFSLLARVLPFRTKLRDMADANRIVTEKGTVGVNNLRSTGRDQSNLFTNMLAEAEKVRAGKKEDRVLTDGVVRSEVAGSILAGSDDVGLPHDYDHAEKLPLLNSVNVGGVLLEV
ncbi:dihydrofolate reductase-like domain-containing protein [Echria macrotheca]|uniref:2,5-diamino-6-ribosylamino-4(3H)-pyrimidinone 5'-phosphate reductase n=1 Tax=Echria macrotheca TaxID=438768 RepID=A0AAJ0F4P2_9PEZI|nr:dihydrofolate reductase-like domain-containing protein [Echria macrotheca]